MPTGPRVDFKHCLCLDVGAAHQFSVFKTHWHKELAYLVTPKSGPMRRMTTLYEANEALIRDLPQGWPYRPHWRQAAQLIVRAAKTGDAGDIRQATDELVEAIEVEGWMSRAMPPS